MTVGPIANTIFDLGCNSLLNNVIFYIKETSMLFCALRFSEC